MLCFEAEILDGLTAGCEGEGETTEEHCLFWSVGCREVPLIEWKEILFKEKVRWKLRIERC